jgi:hypothetical protein
VFSEKDAKDNAVHSGILSVIGNHPDLRARLAITVHAPFPLLMTGGVPRQVVMEDGVEVALQVDAFTETIGGHEYALRELGECADTVFPLGRS